ncbi:hypothetical protein ACFVX3_19660 [Rhodococcus erythropolis]
MPKILFGVATALTCAVLVQFHLAAVGTFSTAGSGRYAAHEIVGTIVLPILSLLAVAICLLMRGDRVTVLLAAAPLLGVLVEFALFALNLWLSGGPTTSGTIKWPGTLILGLHPLIGLVILGSCLLLWKRACRAISPSPSPSAVTVVSVSAEN